MADDIKNEKTETVQKADTPADAAAGKTETIQKADASAEKADASPEKDANPYIDELDNDESDLRDMKLAQERVISTKDRRILGLLAGADILVFTLIGIYLIMTGAANE